MPIPLRGHRLLAASVLLVAATFTMPFAFARKKDKPAQPDPASNSATTSTLTMDEQKRTVHALNRLTFGPRPGDVERVSQMGVDKWIELQLRPDKIDNSALDARLAPFRTLRMNTNEIVENFPSNQMIKQIADGKASMPRDPTKRAVYEAQLERYENKQERKEESAKVSATSDAQNSDKQDPAKTGIAESDAEETRRREERRAANVRAQELLDLPPDERMREILRMSPEDRRALTGNKGQRADAMMDGMSAQQKETMMALKNPEQVVVDELMQAKLVRAIYSERQLDEVLTDFWLNHFNVFINKGADRYLLTSYERDVIRPHVLGKFEDLLVATAKSPAMMFYLDNWLSVGPNSMVALGIDPHHPYVRRKGKQSSGLNENYGRELMELHTLSVNGGYTQKDVTEVAKVFTGWTLDQPKKGGDFRFEPRMHEPGDKVVLGHRIKQNGEKEGMEVLRLLARNPQTAHFISQKLAMRFVADDPPLALVDRMTKTYLKKNGDIREVLRTMFQSPEFWSQDTYRAKVKTPLEFVVSAVRASGADVEDARALVGTLNNMGMMPYGMMPPTGYSMKADTWVNSSALLGRMNFALGLAAGKIRGVKMDGVKIDSAPALNSQTQPIDAQQALLRQESSLLSGDVSQQTHDTISKQLEDPKISQRRLDDPKRPPNVAVITGLILGSPEFQRR
ncbi:MAG TPA: DUF1800 domain-containing protein [Terriglobales bacterium]|nr:DUF1800 domain-containing protein [Terriglobales bacterium]